MKDNNKKLTDIIYDYEQMKEGDDSVNEPMDKEQFARIIQSKNTEELQEVLDNIIDEILKSVKADVDEYKVGINARIKTANKLLRSEHLMDRIIKFADEVYDAIEKDKDIVTKEFFIHMVGVLILELDVSGEIDIKI